MALTVIWTAYAEHALMRLPRSDAEAIDARIQDFARTMTGAISKPIDNGFEVTANGVRAGLLVQEEYEMVDDGDRWVVAACWVLWVRR